MRYVMTLLLLTPFCAADDKDKSKSADKGKVTKEHPMAKAKVGDWVSYKSTTAAPGLPKPIVSTTKQMVKEKTDSEVTLSVESSVDGNSNTQDTKIDLKQVNDPLNPPPVDGVKMTVKKLGAGKEKLTIGGKTYDCEWMHLEINMEVQGTNTKTTTKEWTCKDVPCGGIVKYVSETTLPNAGGTTTSTLELTGHGTKK